MSTKLVIIDTDCGLDDVLAILLAAYCHRHNMIDILAITCSYGNTSCDNVTKNVALTLRASGLQVRTKFLNDIYNLYIN